jgi:hypothetical protein
MRPQRDDRLHCTAGCICLPSTSASDRRFLHTCQETDNREDITSQSWFKAAAAGSGPLGHECLVHIGTPDGHTAGNKSRKS